MTEEERRVARHYDSLFEDELKRLPVDSPVEFAMTWRCIRRYARPGMLAVEIGVGGGHYSELLARAGCELVLVDISERLLENTVGKLRQAGLDGRVGAAHPASALERPLPDAAADLVLLMGPLYHLQEEAGRRRAVAESSRLLKPGGVLFAAGINRLAYLRDFFRTDPHCVVDRREFHRAYLRDGKLDPQHAPPIGYAHLTTAAEFRELFRDGFEELALVGVESFTTAWQSQINELPREEAELWLDLVEATSETAEGLGRSDHFLYIGRRPKR